MESAQKKSTLIDAHTRTSIDASIQASINAYLAPFEDRLPSFTYRLNGVYYPLRDRVDSVNTRLDALQQEHKMHASEVARERLKNQWTGGDETIRSFIGTWFLLNKDEMDTCIQPRGHFDHY
ncbi:hypothetical protein IGI04_030435 [Brassica rapa subsp. trilocularis]|uniref:Uncharacterized protein n=1 Tax=Brassica rapa subsp. trilocularis TaxID=1813537 RepID=A0ABQ7LQQ8_BRACM|nr:hypothetical protein IGI04_030435 [Brassica rapa subsp. trilocularis]